MGPEHRAFIRHAVRWDAEIHSHSGRTLAMEIRDFCEGGAFLTATTRNAAAALKEAVSHGDTLRLSIRDPFNGREHRAQVRAAHVITAGLGVSFHHPAPNLLMGLMAVNAGQVARPDPGSAEDGYSPDSHEREQFAKALAACRMLISDYIDRGLDGFIAQAGTGLLAASGDAPTPAEQAALFNARKRVQARSDELRRSFTAGLESAWASLGEFQLPGDGGEAGTLALVDEADFEDWLARSELITRAESRSQRRLRLLHRRLSRAVDSPIDEQRNPLSPAALCHYLSHELDGLRLNSACRKIVYKAFGKTLLQQVGVLYDGLNERLREHGVLPDLEAERHSIAKVRSSGPMRADSAHGAQEATRAGPPQTTPARPAAGGALSGVIDSVRSLFRWQRDRHGQPVAGDGAPREAVRKAAAAVQSPRERGQSLREQVEAQLQVGGEVEGGTGLDAETAEALELLDTWLAGVQRTGSDTDQLKAWVNRLTPAALRLELNDGGFLAHREHGLHRLIDHLDRAADVVAALEPPERERVRASVEDILAAVNREADKPGTLGHACEALSRLTQDPQRRVSAKVEQLRERYEGSERLQAAQRSVQIALDERLAERSIPQPLHQLLDGGLQQHLVLTWLREGTGSDAWARGLRVVDLLFQALGGTDGARYPVKQPERFVQYLGHHLRRLGRPTEEVATVEQALAHWIIGEGRSKTPPQVQMPPAQAPAAQPDLPPEWRGQAKLLAPRAWVVFQDAEGPPRPRRLAWTDDRRSRFVFVDEGGRKAEELELPELARAFGEGRASSGGNLAQPATERRWQEMLEALNRQLLHQATHDDLTGLLNRRTFERRICHVLAQTGGSRAAVCQFSLDDFKLVNHTLGHKGGDQLLRKLAQRLREAAGDQAAVGRVGGDEFAVLLPGQSTEAGSALAEGQRRAIRDWRPEVDGTAVSLSASVGVLGFSAETHVLTDVLRDLDNACTAARAQGGNRCHVTHAEDVEAADLRHSMAQVARVDAALESDALRLSCQRIEPLGGERLPLYEVFISVAGDSQDGIRPSEFIPAAERYGRMPAVDRWVIRNTFAWCARNPGRLHALDAVSINLSAQTLKDIDFPDWLSACLQQHGVPADMICFELPETAVAANLGLAADLLRALQAMGCRLALDDFGGGLSSYGSLKNLPAEILKIDGAFIRDMDRNTADRSVVKSVHDLAHLLGKLTVAKYVETDEAYRQARELGLDYAQGYHVERPRPLDELGMRGGPTEGCDEHR